MQPKTKTGCQLHHTIKMVWSKNFVIMMFCLYQVNGAKSPLYVFNQVVNLSSNQTGSTPGADVDDIEAVLGDQVSLATCRVTCINQFSPCDLTPMCGHCQHVCSLLVETPACAILSVRWPVVPKRPPALTIYRVIQRLDLAGTLSHQVEMQCNEYIYDSI